MARPLLPALALAGLLAACTASQAAPTPSPTPSASPTPLPPIVASWDLDGEPVELGDGLAIGHCVGDAPLLCVTRGDEVVGVLSIDGFPLDDAMAAAEDADELLEALLANAEARMLGVVEDRAIGCPDGYEGKAHPATEVLVDGLRGVRVGMSGTEDGGLAERVVTWSTVAAGQHWIIVAEAASDDACMTDPELQLFDPAELDALVPLLDRVMSGTPLPEHGTRVAPGTVIGIDGGIESGMVHVFADGELHRVQQPRAMTAEDLDAMGIELGAPVVHVHLTEAPTDAFFAVVPPDGSDARLHLVVDAVAHPVVVQEIAAEAVEGIPTAGEPRLGHVAPGVA